MSDVEAIGLFSEGAAKAAGKPWQGLVVGAPADFVVFERSDDAPWTVTSVQVGRP